jgi:hypothetical protein
MLLNRDSEEGDGDTELDEGHIGNVDCCREGLVLLMSVYMGTIDSV